MISLAPAVQTLLSLVAGLLPKLSLPATGVAGEVIAGLKIIVPILADAGPSLVKEAQSIIGALRNGSTPLTPAELADLDVLDAQLDAQFEADAAAAGAPPAPV